MADSKGRLASQRGSSKRTNTRAKINLLFEPNRVVAGSICCFHHHIKKGERRQRGHAEGERPDDWLYVGIAPFRTEPVPRQWGGGGHIKEHSVIHF